MNVYTNGDHDTAADTSRAGDGDFASGGEQLAGYLRFDCHSADPGGLYLLLTQGALLVMELFLLIVLFLSQAASDPALPQNAGSDLRAVEGQSSGRCQGGQESVFGKFLWD